MLVLVLVLVPVDANANRHCKSIEQNKEKLKAAVTGWLAGWLAR